MIGSFASTVLIRMNCCPSPVYRSTAQPWIYSAFCFVFKSGFFDSGSVEAPGFISSSSPPTSVSFSLFHCRSYKYAQMKYTMLLVVNDVLWYSLRLWDSAVFIVLYDVFILVFMIMISQ